MVNEPFQYPPPQFNCSGFYHTALLNSIGVLFVILYCPPKQRQNSNLPLLPPLFSVKEQALCLIFSKSSNRHFSDCRLFTVSPDPGELTEIQTHPPVPVHTHIILLYTCVHLTQNPGSCVVSAIVQAESSSKSVIGNYEPRVISPDGILLFQNISGGGEQQLILLLKLYYSLDMSISPTQSYFLT